ncbi:MAG: ferritin, partial [Nitrospirae bacterium]
LNAEFYSSYLYLSMSAYFHSMDLDGFAHWMRVQTQEELLHAMKVYDYINERGGRVILKQIDGPSTEWASPLEAFEEAYTHEQKMTKMINELTSMAIEEKDHATNVFLQWFINEQVEEEANVKSVVQTLKMIGDAKDSLFFYDRELAKRTSTMPMATQ